MIFMQVRILSFQVIGFVLLLFFTIFPENLSDAVGFPSAVNFAFFSCKCSIS